jgi:acyl-coenzyme A thioesterase PaaI-like protein
MSRPPASEPLGTVPPMARDPDLEPLFSRATGGAADGDAEVWQPGPLTRGPWDPGALHGGPVAGLLARACERAPQPAIAGGAPAPAVRLARLTVELLRPVPVEPLTVRAQVVRPGRKLRLVEAEVLAGGRPVARAVGLLLRREPVVVPAADPGETPPAGPDQAHRSSILTGEDFAYPAFHTDGAEIRLLGGPWRPGPTEAWIRLARPLVPGEEPSPAQRACAAADFGNGISAVLPFERWRFVNPDLSVHLARDPVGEWICLRARTDLGDSGGAVAESALFDTAGRVGRSAQTLLVEDRDAGP